jgi:hypothetical protein
MHALEPLLGYLGSIEDPSSEQIEICPPEHLPFHGLQPIDLAFELAITHGKRQPSQHCRKIRREPQGKAEGTTPARFSRVNPASQPPFIPLALVDHVKEGAREGCRLREVRICLSEQRKVGGFFWSTFHGGAYQEKGRLSC